MGLTCYFRLLKELNPAVEGVARAEVSFTVLIDHR
jgi:hypothetical protein